ncbi:MAG: CBS domain-containing protein [Bacteriovoracaceae bacterium]|nr:CBS domain-containing protein [Bacteriovoracaceae bacterium]
MITLPAALAKIEAYTLMASPVWSVQEGISVRAAIELLLQKKISGMPVLDAQERLTGIVTEQDLLLQAAQGNLAQAITYTPRPIYVFPQTSMADLVQIFYQQHFKRIPVVNQNLSVVGIISRRDVLQKLHTY